MKLYFSPAACSLSPHIALHEAGLAFETERVDLKTKKTASGEDFNAINPTGYVPALRLDDGQLLTEGPAIVQYIADQAPGKALAPAPASFERLRLQEWLTFINSELHKTLASLFNPALPPEARTMAIANAGKRLAWTDTQLAGRAYLMGETFTVADGYLFTVVNWTNFVGMPLDAYPNLQAYMGRVAARPGVQAALKAEGLLK
jgi:glutathione S-transferase